MSRKWMIALAASAFVATPALADPMSDTGLQNINGPVGAGNATTTSDATGTRTTVTGPGGGANRATGTPVAGQWFQANVGGGGTVGITSDFSKDGNGAAYFATTSGDSKADLQYYFNAPTALSGLTGVSYDFYRDSSSTINSGLAPVLRLDILKDGSFAGQLVYEFTYQNQTAPVADQWTTLSGNLNSGIFWATNAKLGPTFAMGDGSKQTLSDWINANAGSNLTVAGVNLGVGSGWNGGTSRGAIDNVLVSFNNGTSVTSDFQVASLAGGVPEPATWALMILGFGAVGASLRRSRRTTGQFARTA